MSSRIIVLLALFLLFRVGVNAFVIDGDSVFIEDEQASLKVTPHTAQSPVNSFKQEFEVCNKTGTATNIYAGYIFDKALSAGKVEYWQQPAYGWIESETHCEYDFNYSLNENSGQNPHKAWCFETIDQNGIDAIIVHWEQEFKTGSLETATIQWDLNQLIFGNKWVDVTASFQNNHAILPSGKNIYPYIEGLSIAGNSCENWRIEYSPNAADTTKKWDLWLWADTRSWNCILTDTCPKTLKLDPWWDAGASWLYKQKITVKTSDILIGDITNDHVILVDINSSNTDFWANVDATGKDVRFVNASENGEYDYHFELFDADADRMIAWVEIIDTYTSASDLEFYMYYGNSEAIDAQNETGTYNASYSDVYHMHDASSPQTDSCTNDYDLTHGNTPSLQDDGKIGYGIEYELPNEYSTNATEIMGTEVTAWTVMMWVKKTAGWDSTETEIENMWTKGTNTSNGFALNRWQNDGTIQFWTSIDAVVKDLRSTKDNWTANTWYHITFVFNGTTHINTLYVNASTGLGGIETDTGQSTWVAGTARPFNISASNNGAEHCAQFVDEIKVFHGTALTEDEVKLIYVSENIGLLEFGSQESSNTAPTWTSIDLNIVYAKIRDDIKVTATGTADGQSDDLTLLCGTTTEPTTDTNNFCTSFGIASPYSTVECVGTGTTGDGNNTVYCRLYDGLLYSEEKTQDYIADNTAPATIHNNFTSGWVNIDANIQFNCFDVGTGCQDFYYTVDDVNFNVEWGDENFSIVLTSDGNHEIFYWSADSVGNIEVLEPTYYAIDKTAPTIQYVFPVIDFDTNTALVTFLVKLDEVGKCYYGIFINSFIDYNSSTDSNSDFVCVINYFGFVEWGDTAFLVTNTVEDSIPNTRADVWKTGIISYVKPAGVLDVKNIEDEDVINVGWFIFYKAFAGLAIFIIPLVGLIAVFALFYAFLKR